MAEIGTTLRNARIQRGLTIEQAAQDTRISPRFLEALEAEEFASLPAPVYVRGFLRSYANYLRVDAAALLASLEGGGPPVAGPDAFVGGPPALRPQAQSSRPDPFRSPQRPERPPVPPPPPVVDEPVEDAWAPEEPVGYVGSPEELAPSGEPDDEPEYPPEEPVFRPRRVAGVLVEREPADGGSGRAVRLLVMAGGAAIVALVIGIAALALSRGGGDDTNPAAGATETPTRAAGTIIPVVSPTAKPSASASPSASVSPSPSVSTSPSPTGTPGTPTPTATNRPNPPAATATPTETPTPTATPVPPTPIPPTPRPTPFPAHALYWDECLANNNSCGEPPIRVVCVPDGSWFVDLPPLYAAPSSWLRSVQRPLEAQTVCP